MLTIIAGSFIGSLLAITVLGLVATFGLKNALLHISQG